MKSKQHLLCSFLFLLFLFYFQSLLAAGGPDAFGYRWKGSNDPGGPVYQWFDILQKPDVVEVKLLTDDNYRGPYALGFQFPFYQELADSFWIGSNGFICFDPGLFAQPYYEHPNPTWPNNLISAMGADLSYEGDSVSKCYFWLNPAHDTLIVSWIDVPFFTPTPPWFTDSLRNTLQMILSLEDTSITFNYQNISPYTHNSQDFCSIGIENNSGSIGLSCLHNLFPADLSSIKITRDDVLPPSVADLEISAVNETNNKGIIKHRDYQFIPKVKITNTGNLNLNTTVNLQCRIFNPDGSILLTQNRFLHSLAAGRDTTLSFSNTCTLSDTGNYKVEVSHDWTIDTISYNNENHLEIMVIDSSSAVIWLNWTDDVRDSEFEWNGFGGGMGAYYPLPAGYWKLDGIKVHTGTVFQNGSFDLDIFYDLGLDYIPGPSLWNYTLPDSMVIPHAWNFVEVNPSLYFGEEGVFASWKGNGTGVRFTLDGDAPFSKQSAEVHGSIWAPLRYQFSDDPMIAIRLQKIEELPADIRQTIHHSNIFSVYPNPAGHEISITSSPNFNPVKLEIFSHIGELVYHENLNPPGPFFIHLPELPKACYLLRLTNQHGNTAHQKILIIH